MMDSLAPSLTATNSSSQFKVETIPPQDEDEDITISLSIFQRTFAATDAYIRSQCHLQTFWSISHFITIIGSLLYVFALFRDNTRLQHSSYKLTTWGTVTTYLIVLYRSNFEEQIVVNEEKEEVILEPKVMCISELMKNENAQLLGYICLWIFTEATLIKLVPFFIYSLVNLSSYFTLDLIPNSGFSNALLPLLNYFELPLLSLASHFDLLAMSYLTKEAYSSGSAYPLVIYLCIWALRYENSEISRSSIKGIVTTIDQLFFMNFIPMRLQAEYALWRTYCTFMIPLDTPKYLESDVSEDLNASDM